MINAHDHMIEPILNSAPTKLDALKKIFIMTRNFYSQPSVKLELPIAFRLQSSVHNLHS